MTGPAGYSGTPLAKKLGIRAGHRVATFGAPVHIPEILAPLPEDVRLEPEPDDGRPFDVLLLFVRDREALEARFPEAKALLDWSGGLWVAWPKQSSPLAGELRQSGVQEVGLGAGLVDNKVCAVDDDWSGLRFVYRVEDRPGG